MHAWQLWSSTCRDLGHPPQQICGAEQKMCSCTVQVLVSTVVSMGYSAQLMNQYDLLYKKTSAIWFSILHVHRISDQCVYMKCRSVAVTAPTWRRVLTTHNGLVTKIVAAPAPPAASTLDPIDILWWIVCPPTTVWRSGSQLIRIRALDLTTSNHKHLNQEPLAPQPSILILYSVLYWKIKLATHHW